MLPRCHEPLLYFQSAPIFDLTSFSSCFIFFMPLRLRFMAQRCQMRDTPALDVVTTRCHAAMFKCDAPISAYADFCCYDTLITP